MPIDSNTWFLTVNNRLARELHQQYDQQQAAQNKSAWSTSNILPWSAWLQLQYEALTDLGFNQRILLNQHQEKLLWQQIVKQHNPELLRPKSAARTAQQAWQLMCAWLLNVDEIAQQASEETLIFLQWLQAFREYCIQHDFITQAELLDLCFAGVQENVLDLSYPIELIGFDDISPQQQRLLEHLNTVQTLAASQQAAETHRITLDTLEDEIYAAAHWAKHQLAQNPQQHIGIVSLNLSQDRNQFIHILRKVISPHSFLPGASDKLDFNLSLGQPLAEYPLVAQLLLALQLTQHKAIALKDISVILRSPFIGGHEQEAFKRANLDFVLHDEGLAQLTPNRLLRKARECEASDLLERLQQLHIVVNGFAKYASPTEWSGHLLTLFNTLGWPGKRSHLSSSEYQQVERLRRLMSEFSSLSLVKSRMSLTEAISQFRQLCEETTFQPETSNSRLSVLGILEAAGMQFDSIWVLGMDDQQWPPAATPNPLLPIHLQRERALPHASSARELLYAQQLTQRLQHSAKSVIASYARQVGDKQQNPSALIREWAEIDWLSLNVTPDLTFKQNATEIGRTDELPIPEAIPPKQVPSGGSHLLSSQAACPFQAVARFRLQAQALPTPQATHDARLNGQILHQLLHSVWESIQNSEQLHSLDESALKTLIKPKAETVLQDLGRRRPDIFTSAFIPLETDRLTDLIAHWLDTVEKQRGQAFQVLTLEERQNIELNGLPLRLQADRVDQLENGGLAIIDYKSGQTQTPDWLDERPSDLQIPLYCTQAEQPHAALLAQVNSQQSRFRGMVSHQNIAPDVEALQTDASIDEWQALLTHWQHILGKLAEEIQQGHAEVAPKNDKACVYCGMQPLCRINANG